MNSRQQIADAQLERLQRQSFSYFLHEMNPDNGLIKEFNHEHKHSFSGTAR
jgi:hypothetical protein